MAEKNAVPSYKLFYRNAHYESIDFYLSFVITWWESDQIPALPLLSHFDPDEIAFTCYK